MPVTRPPKTIVEMPMMLSVEAVANHFCVTPATIRAAVRRGQFPPPTRLGRRLSRWSAVELAAWVEAGCPECGDER